MSNPPSDHNGLSSLQTAEFSLLPTTQTTTVTTTTTISTKFPPIVFKKPCRRVEEWDPTMYPLRDAATPSSLREFSFELDGSAATFVENEHSEQALIEVSQIPSICMLVPDMFS